MSRPLRLAAAALVLAAACGPVESADLADDGAAVVRNAIVGGTPTTGDPNVYMLFIRSSQGGSICTATLIAPRTLLTAAHCVDPRILGATSVSIIATNAPTEAQVAWGTNTVRVTETRMHPGWNPTSLANDIALAYLASPQLGVTPKPWNSQSLAGYGGRPVRAVGYGSTGNDQGSGTKRTVDLTLRQLSQTLLWLGNFVDKGICHGDSGGPTFHTFSDGVERVVGVHSFTRGEQCVDGADTRVDAYADFVRQWLAEKEDECGQNGICAVGACATPDPDCVSDGDLCSTEFACKGRRCVGDAQHPQPYCSRGCVTSADCTNGLVCDTLRQVCQYEQLPEVAIGEACTPNQQWCGPSGVCTGPSASETRCSQPCSVTADCPNGQRCKSAYDGINVCMDPPPILLPLATAEGAVPSGCATAPELLAVLAVFSVLRRRRPVR